MEISDLPTLNAVLNATSACFLLLGYSFVRRRRISAHRACMVAACSVSTAFLASYLFYHYHAGSKPFLAHGWVRPLYFVILISHVVLAALIVPLALVTLRRALGAQWERHRQIARWALPLWLYVSVTGVIVYWMLYHLAASS